MIQPVIALIERQRPQIEKLVDYCRRLDGTEIKVIPVSDDGFKVKYPNNRHGCLAVHSLHTVAKVMDGEPFIWLEPDATPLKPGWAAALSDEYELGKKPFMLSADSNPPHDLVGGIGVYDPPLTLLMPDTYARGAWDLWMLQNMREHIHFTPLIQHSYARYPKYKGTLEFHRFPRDREILRSDAVIFHADKFQELMRTDLPAEPKPPTKRFLHRGKFGDIIAALPSIKALGGGDLVITDKPAPGCVPPLNRRLYQAIEPLLKAQPYLTSVSFEPEPVGITHDFHNFQVHIPWRDGRSLVEWQAAYIGATVTDLEPWLMGVKPQRMRDRVVICRSARYHNPAFPWREILKRIGKTALFVGLPEEHEAFAQEFDCRWLECYYPADMLEAASIIAGAKLFIGNQSSPFWLAAGVGAPIIQEVWQTRADSVIPRANAFYPQSEFAFRRLFATFPL
jgi:hypothetical protein